MPQKRRERSKKLSRKGIRDLEIKIQFLEGVLHRDPEYVEALQLLGDHYTERGLHERSLEVDRKLAHLDPANPLVHYNLACSHALNSQFKEAVSALDTAINLGYRDFKWLAKDPDLKALRKAPAFEPIQEKIRNLKIEV